MITNDQVNEFIGNLSQHLQILITRIGNQESWSSDNEKDVNQLIDELSESLENTSPETLSKASHLLLTNSAYFNLPRFLKFITFIAEKNPRAVNQMLSPLNKEKIGEGEVYLNTVLSRLRYLIQSVLISEVFAPETMKRVQLAVLEYERLKNKPEKVETEAEPEKKEEITDEDIANMSEDFDMDMPFSTDSDSTDETDVVEASEDANVVEASEDTPETPTSGDEINTSSSNNDDFPTSLNIQDTPPADKEDETPKKKSAGEKDSYEFKKKAVLDLLNQMTEQADSSND